MLRRLSNFSERCLRDEIVGTVAAYHASIYQKVRVADVVDITRLSRSPLRTYALQAHLDICVADEDEQPVFAIEFDGAGHDPARDPLKNAIAVEAGLALFRVSESLLGRQLGGMTFLQYLVHTSFLGREFLSMQRRGEMAYDEPFMMSGFLSDCFKSPDHTWRADV